MKVNSKIPLIYIIGISLFICFKIQTNLTAYQDDSEFVNPPKEYTKQYDLNGNSRYFYGSLSTVYFPESEIDDYLPYCALNNYLSITIDGNEYEYVIDDQAYSHRSTNISCNIYFHGFINNSKYFHQMLIEIHSVDLPYYWYLQIEGTPETEFYDYASIFICLGTVSIALILMRKWKKERQDQSEQAYPNIK
jgi:hypothetical protein